MARKYLDEDAPHVYINAFPNGTVSLSWRTKEGHETEEELFEVGGYPVHLMIKRSDQVLSVSYSVDGKRWWPLQDRILYRLPAVCYVGAAVTSHDNRYLTTASFRSVRVKGKEIE